MFNKKPPEKIINDLIFAFTISKFVNSNAIVIAKELATIGIGVGQTNRIDSANQAIERMKENFGMLKLSLLQMVFSLSLIL